MEFGDSVFDKCVEGILREPEQQKRTEAFLEHEGELLASQPSVERPRTSSGSVTRVPVALDDNPLLSPSSTPASLEKEQGEENLEEYPEIRYGNDIILSEVDRTCILHNVTNVNRRISLFDAAVDMEASCGELGLEITAMGGQGGDLILVVTKLLRMNYCPGVAEVAGIQVGDVLLGFNYGSTGLMTGTQLNALPGAIDTTEMPDATKTIYLQCWRSAEVSAAPIPGLCYTNGEHSFAFQAYALCHEGVVNREEYVNFMGILLQYMKGVSKQFFRQNSNHHHVQQQQQQQQQQQLTPPNSRDKGMAGGPAGSCDGDQMRRRRASASYKSPGKESNFLFDMERNILRAKRLRPVLCARVIMVRRAATSEQATVLYVIRVEDVESGHNWQVTRRFNDFYALHERLIAMDLNAGIWALVPALPAKMQLMNIARVIEQRVAGLESYTRAILHSLTAAAAMDRGASDALRLVQTFLGTSGLKQAMLSGTTDDQRSIEMAVFRFLNEPSSSVCAQCKRFVGNTDCAAIAAAAASSSSSSGYLAVLERINEACVEVSAHLSDLYGVELCVSLQSRRRSLSPENVNLFVMKCIRRQVEGCIFLPLRRHALQVISNDPLLDAQLKRLYHAGEVLQHCGPDVFGVPEKVLCAKSLGGAIAALREALHSFLPTDQRLLLLSAAKAMMSLHEEVTSSRAVSPTSQTTAPGYESDSDDAYADNGVARDGDAPRDEHDALTVVQNKPQGERRQEEEEEEQQQQHALTADEFLPLFSFLLSRVRGGVSNATDEGCKKGGGAALRQAGILKEFMLHVGDEGDAIGEVGYYLATMEASFVNLVEVAARVAPS